MLYLCLLFACIGVTLFSVFHICGYVQAYVYYDDYS